MTIVFAALSAVKGKLSFEKLTAGINWAHTLGCGKETCHEFQGTGSAYNWNQEPHRTWTYTFIPQSSTLT